MSKQVIYFDKVAYNSAIWYYNERMRIEKSFKDEALAVAGVELSEINLSDPMQTFYDCLEAKHVKANLLKIKGYKLADVLELDTKNLVEIAKQLHPMAVHNEPLIANYQKTIDNELEQERYDFALKFIEMTREVRAKAPEGWGIASFESLGLGLLAVRSECNTDWVVNPNWVKG